VFVKYFDKVIKILFLYVGGLLFLKERFRYRYLDNVLQGVS